jgi:hypothetical protein
MCIDRRHCDGSEGELILGLVSNDDQETHHCEENAWTGIRQPRPETFAANDPFDGVADSRNAESNAREDLCPFLNGATESLPRP